MYFEIENDINLYILEISKAPIMQVMAYAM